MCCCCPAKCTICATAVVAMAFAGEQMILNRRREIFSWLGTTRWEQDPSLTAAIPYTDLALRVRGYQG